ncbi:MAG: hypothetical protein H0T73_04145 [Ardenticatenales bacterium]|nr:hypothetical protein [Ardenticatenales bacterium]
MRAYVARGTQCDWYNPTCLMISGASDNVVPAWSVWANAEARRISDRSDLHHLEVHHTQEYGSWIFSYLGRTTSASLSTQSATDSNVAAASTDLMPLAEAESHVAYSNYSLRGGALGKQVAESITVEGGLTAVTFSLISNSELRVTVVSPSGVAYESSAHASAPGDILQGTTYAVRVENPEAGQWQVLGTPQKRGGKGSGGFMLYAIYEGGLTVELDTDLYQAYTPSSQLPLTVHVNNGQATKATILANLHSRDNKRVANTQGELNGRSMALPQQAGSYTLDLVITGIAADGTRFERTLVTSLSVGEEIAGR